MRIKLDISHRKHNIFFASDYHFWHNSVIAHDKRPFLFDKKLGYPEPNSKDKSNLNVELMNERLIDNWNHLVTKNDIVFYLGDFSWKNWRDGKEIADQLNGKIHAILGNHDSYKEMNKMERFESISDYIELWVQYGDKPKVDKVQICMMHYPISSWNRKHHGSYMIHGHSHGNLMKDNPKIYEQKIMDVGCNMTDYEPIDFWTIKEIMDNKKPISR